MVWNTIAHPRMMEGGNDSWSDNSGAVSVSPIKFADSHKLSFYDIIVSTTGTIDDPQPILVKGDFEAIKKMLLNNEAVCGALFQSWHDDEMTVLEKHEIWNFEYNYALDAIVLQPDINGDPVFIYLLSDNTISKTEPNEADPIAIGPTAPDPGKS